MLLILKVTERKVNAKIFTGCYYITSHITSSLHHSKKNDADESETTEPLICTVKNMTGFSLLRLYSAVQQFCYSVLSIICLIFKCLILTYAFPTTIVGVVS